MFFFESGICTYVRRQSSSFLQLLKVIAERGKWTRMFEEAEKLYNEGDLDSALMVYLLFSELGVEIAQANAAYLLEQGWEEQQQLVQVEVHIYFMFVFSFVEDVVLVDKNETLKRALVLWNRAAVQGENAYMSVFRQCNLWVAIITNSGTSLILTPGTEESVLICEVS